MNLFLKVVFIFFLAVAVNCGGSSSAGGGVSDEDEDSLEFEGLETRDDGAIRLTGADDGGTISFQNPCFSPEGDFLVFTGFEEGYNDGPAHIYRLDLDVDELGEPVSLTEGDYDDVNVPYGCFDPGTGRVVFASDREDSNDFWGIVPEEGSLDLTRLTEHGELPVWIEPVYSPDGTALAFEQNNEIEEGEDEELAQRASIWRVDIGSGETTQLTNADGDFDDRLPSWSPDGETILFQRRGPPSEVWEAYTIPAEGGDPTNISAMAEKEAQGHDTDLSWSPDGEFAVSSTDPDGIPLPNIYLIPVDGGEMIRVTESDESEDGAPCVSPDGLWGAFESHRENDEDSPSDIWMIRVPGGAL